MGDCSKFLSTLFGTGPQACHRHPDDGPAVGNHPWASAYALVPHCRQPAGATSKTCLPFIARITYLSTSHYTYKLLMGSQFEPEDAYPCGEFLCLVRDYPGIKKAGLDRAGCLGYRIGDKCLLGIGSLPIIVLMRTGMTKRRKPKCFFFPTRSGIPSSSTHDPSSNL